MKGVTKRLSNLGFSLELTEDAKSFLADKGYDQQFGARPLHRAIQKYLEDPLAEEILNLHVKAGDILEADLDKENQKLKFAFKNEGGREVESIKLYFNKLPKGVADSATPFLFLSNSIYLFHPVPNDYGKKDHHYD